MKGQISSALCFFLMCVSESCKGNICSLKRDELKHYSKQPEGLKVNEVNM